MAIFKLIDMCFVLISAKIVMSLFGTNFASPTYESHFVIDDWKDKLLDPCCLHEMYIC